MAGPGRPSNPIHLQIVDKAHAHRYKGVENVQVKKSRPKAPLHLSIRAQHIFNEFVDKIEELGIVSETDIDIYITYATNQEELEYLEDFLRRNGHSYCVESKFAVSYKRYPESEVYKQCKDLKLKILGEFGLTPASRNRIKIQKKEEKPNNPFAMLDSPKETAEA